MKNYKDYIGKVIIDRAIPLGAGAYSDVYPCEYGGTFAYKEFFDSKVAEFVEHRLERIANEFGPSGLILPYRLIYGNQNNLKGYVMDYLWNYRGLDFFMGLDSDRKKSILKRARDLLIKFHNTYACIHADPGTYNFLYNKTIDDIKLIDFDLNISLKDKDLFDSQYYNIFAADYLDNFSIDVGLDIFLFNLTVFSLLNNVDYDTTMEHIANGCYGVFDSDNNAKKILDGYKDFSCKKTLKKEFIDF